MADRIVCRAQGSFSGLAHGEVVEVDPVEWWAFLEAGYLIPLADEPAQRAPVTEPEGMHLLRQEPSDA